MATPYNPIQSVDGASVPCPSSFQWTMEDVSASDAGRTEDGLMHKKRIRQVVRVDLRWDGVNDSAAASLLAAFDPEYINVSYRDPKEGGFVTRTFYVGNRTAPLYNTNTGCWENISFAIIQR